MIKRTATVLGLALMLFVPARSYSSDTHSVFKMQSSFHGRESTKLVEIWTAADRQCISAPFGMTITRKDLGVVWALSNRAKVCREFPLKPQTAPAAPAAKTDKPAPAGPAAIPGVGTDGKVDLRFIEGNDDLPLEWTTEELPGETVQGVPCRVFHIKGVSDFGYADAKLWIASEGRAAGLALDIDAFAQLAQRLDSSIIDKVEATLTGLPDGGIVKMDGKSEGWFGPQSPARLTFDINEKKDAPAGIYEIPEGYKKEVSK